MATINNRSSQALREGLVLADDLLFASQVQGLARAAGVALKWTRTIDQALALAAATPPACIILDVHVVGEGLAGFISSLATKCKPAPLLIGFGSHVDAASLQRARDAGCTLVLPRSKLVQELIARLAAAKWGEEPAPAI
jgi:DNA-binding response OmpR family regulator